MKKHIESIIFFFKTCIKISTCNYDMQGVKNEGESGNMVEAQWGGKKGENMVRWLKSGVWKFII